MTGTAPQRWPRIGGQRRAVIVARAAEGGGACTLIVIREPGDGCYSASRAPGAPARS